jgi:hypothetical protein
MKNHFHQIILKLLGIQFICTFLALSPIALGNQAPSQNLKELIQDSLIVGSGKFTYFGLNIYQAKYLSLESSIKNSIALELKYSKNFSGESIANETIKQMRKIGVNHPNIEKWGNDLKNIFPDIEKGHTLTGVYIPQKGTIFLHNGNKIGEMLGDEFSKAFFGIWLDPKTSAPELRTQLLSEKCLPNLIVLSCR